MEVKQGSPSTIFPKWEITLPTSCFTSDLCPTATHNSCLKYWYTNDHFYNPLNHCPELSMPSSYSTTKLDWRMRRKSINNLILLILSIEHAINPNNRMTPPLKELQENNGKPNLIFLITRKNLPFQNHLKPPPGALLYCILRQGLGPASKLLNPYKETQHWSADFRFSFCIQGFECILCCIFLLLWT